MTERRPTTRRPRALAPAPLPGPPWWWSVACSVGAGLLAVALGLLFTLHRLSPDPFAMALIGGGFALAAGVNARIALARALGPVARALTEDPEDDAP